MSVENQWFVRLPAGNVITVSLDDLDAAFQRGDIDENTLVFKQGMKEWLPLGEAAGLDDEPHASHAPVATAPPPYASPLAVQEVDAYSVRPMAFDMPNSVDSLDAEYGETSLKPSKKKLIFGVLAAAAVIGLGIIGATSVAGANPSAANASMAPAVAAVAPPPAVTAIPVAAPQEDHRLSDDQKKALMVHDDKLKADQAKKAQERAAKAPRPSVKRTKAKDPMIKGGNKYDPLNASL
jgi:hypothetical protein